MGTKFCTKCGTFLETGVTITAAGEKKPERVYKLPKKEAEPTPPAGGVEEVPEVEEAEAPAGAEAVEPELAEAAPAVEAGEEIALAEAPAAVEAAEVAVPARPERRGKKKLLGLLVAVAAVVVAVAVLSPGTFSNILKKAKSVVGLGRKVAKEKERKDAAWSGVSEDARSAIESLQGRISSTLKATLFSERQRPAFERDVAEFLRGAEAEFTDTDAFVSLAAKLEKGDLGDAASFLEEEKGFLGADRSTPRIDAIQGAVQILLGRERKGMPLLASAVKERAIARTAASFCKGAVEGCLNRLSVARAGIDPWASVAEILRVKKEDLRDEFLAPHCGKVLSALRAVQVLAGQPPAGPGRKIRTGAFVRLFKRGDSLVQAALVELGETDPASRRSILKHKPVLAAYVTRLLSELQQGEPGADTRLLEALKEGLSVDPDNAFYNYALASVYLQTNKEEEAIAQIAAGNDKPVYRDYARERMTGLAVVLDTPLPYTAATITVSSAHLSALAGSSRGLLESAGSSFRVGRRKEVFQMFGQWRRMCERLRAELFTFGDALIVIGAAVPLMAAEAEFCTRDGREADAWKVRESLAENWRLAAAIGQATYGFAAELFVKEAFSDEGYGEEFSRTSPQEVFGRALSRAAGRLEAILAQDPARASVQGVNLQDQNYVMAKRFLDEKKYDFAFRYANACLTQNPGHVWAFKVMQEAVKRASADLQVAGPKAVVYWQIGRRDLSVPGVKRLEYDIGVAKDTTQEQAIATARSALEGFWKKEKADAVRIYVMRERSRAPCVRLTWAPGGDWQKAKEGTPYTDFEEGITVFDKQPL
jgi:hypothetical protein